MAKNSGNTIVNRAAQFLSSKGECTPDELNSHLAVGNYASKYVLYMKIAGHSVDTVKNGRKVVKYVYVSGPASAAGATGTAAVSMPKAARLASKQTKAVKSAKTTKPKAAKPAKKVIVVEDDKPVMDHSRKIQKIVVDDVEATFGSSGSIGSYSVDNDWDALPSTFTRRDLGV